MRFERLVDLSHTILPDQGPRPLRAEMVPPPELGAFPVDQWYVMHQIGFLDHIGTHVEAPYHVVQQGQDVASIPLEQLCGEAVVLDLTQVGPGGDVTLDLVQQAAESAGGVRRGDVVLCRFDYDRYYGRSDRPAAPHFTSEAIEWLVAQGMKLMGVDSGGIELPSGDPRAARQHNHHLLLDRGIPLIENLAHLSQLTRPRVTVFAFPVAVGRLDSFPLRVVALEA